MAAHYTVFATRFDQALLERHRHKAQALHVVAIDQGRLPGFHRQLQADPSVTLDLVNATIRQLMPELSLRLDHVVLKGIAEAGADWIRNMARLCQPGATLECDTLTEAQYKGLADVGFAFDAARRRARYMSRKPAAPEPAPPQRRAIVIGAGLAGSAASQRLCARGWQVTLVERHPLAAMEASGNLAGVFMPLLSRDDNLSTRATRAAYLFALHYWDTLGNAFLGERCGVLQLARDAAHARTQRAIAGQWNYPREFAEWLERAPASALLGRDAPDGAWLFRQGGWARPSSVCQAMLEACGDRLERIFNTGTVGLRRDGDQWQVFNQHGALARAATVVVANGIGALDLEQTAQLPLQRVRGQVTHLAAAAAPRLPCVLCREAYMTPAVEGIVSTGATYDDAVADPALLPTCQHENLRKARQLVGEPLLGSDAPLAGRVGFRCVPPDRLPLAGPLPDYAAGMAASPERLRDVPRLPGLHGLLGYASRGLIWAPLAAELLAAQLQGEPLPVENKIAAALDPARFLLAGRWRNTS
jgi:tRNA 5-methylaminomethyl-2-thiouridine biosynthesis bifunctional protein